MTILPKRTKAITIRLSEADSLVIHGRALSAGMSLSEYIRTTALGAQPTLTPAPTPVPAVATQPIVARRYLVSSSDGDDAA